MIFGTITEFSHTDGVGWIEADSGEKIRFGGTALSGFQEVVLGTRVAVTGTKPGYKGVPKATGVVPETLAHREPPAKLPTWVSLWLRQPISASALIAAAAQVGVRIEETQEGLHVEGRFFASLVDEYPHAPSQMPEGVSLPACCLHISGGTNEGEAILNQTRGGGLKVTSEKLLNKVLPPGTEPVPAPPKIRDLTKITAALAPLCTAIALPKANHVVMTPHEFVEKAQATLDGQECGYRLWTRTLYHRDPKAHHLATSGMWVFGLPDLAIPVHDDLDERVGDLGALMRQMVEAGESPPAGAYETARGPMQVVPLHSACWVQPSGSPFANRAFAAFGQYRNMQTLLDGTTHRRSIDAGSLLAIEYFHRSNGLSVAMSNGVSSYPQRGGTDEEKNRRVELVIHSASLGPWAEFWLSWASNAVARSAPEHPVRAYDRLTLDQPRDGIAGAIVWPVGHMKPLGPENVSLWELLPFTPEELQSFRADPSAQSRWLDAHESPDGLDRVRMRWGSRNGAPS